MDLGLNNKIVLVTAASQGLGKASALSIANEGATCLLYTSPSPRDRG